MHFKKGYIMIFHIETDHFKYRNTMNNNDDWQAALDNYDGAPDSPSRHEIGLGKTEIDAIESLIECLDGQDIYIDLGAIGIIGECHPQDYYQHIQTVKAQIEKEKAEAYAEDNGLSMVQALRIGAA